MPSVELDKTTPLELNVNAVQVDELYLECLNLCFPGWGGRSIFDWAFKRPMHGCPTPDLLTLKLDGILIAGSAVNYRKVIQPSGESILVGIMTGSWTLPEARGRGCFSRMISSSQELVRRQGGALLLAFVTAANASRYQLQKAGANLAPTSYFESQMPASTARSHEADSTLVLVEGDLDPLLAELWRDSQQTSGGILYSRFEGWKLQFVDRPWQTTVYQDRNGSTAIIEQHSTSDKLLFWTTVPGYESQFLRCLVDLSHASKKSLFAFSSSEEQSAFLRQAGFDEQSGFITTMNVDSVRQDEFAPGSRVETDPSGQPSDLEVGSMASGWRFQSGDRM